MITDKCEMWTSNKILLHNAASIYVKGREIKLDAEFSQLLPFKIMSKRNQPVNSEELRDKILLISIDIDPLNKTSLRISDTGTSLFVNESEGLMARYPDYFLNFLGFKTVSY